MAAVTFFNFNDIVNSLKSVIESITLNDLLDMLIMTFIIYKGIQLIKETRAGQLIKGLILMVIVYSVSIFLELKVLQYVLKAVLDVGLLALIIIFQPELRRILEKFGQAKVTSRTFFGVTEMQERTNGLWRVAIDEICEACEELSSTYTGALIVIEQQTKLGEQISTGTLVNANPTKELFGNIFYPKTPLHDGAVIMRDGIILAAACFLPKPQNEENINKKLGSRHRAAIGMSENSDAIVIVVSEETGQISVAENGILTRNLSVDNLRKTLNSHLIPKPVKTPDKTKNSKPQKLKVKIVNTPEANKNKPKNNSKNNQKK